MMGFIGWFAATVLLGAIGRQVYSQWRGGSNEGLSRWLFIGQIPLHSRLSFTAGGNWIVVTNVLTLGTAMAGEWVLLVNRRRSAFSGHRR